MAKITIYGKNYCPYCVFAKDLLEQMNVAYEYIDMTEDSLLQTQVFEKACGAKTVPQIFFGDVYIGGFSELKECYEKGELQALLEKNA